LATPRNLGYVYHGLFFVIVSVLWILWELGSIDNVLQLIGTFLILYGIGIVGTHLLAGAQERQGVSR